MQEELHRFERIKIWLLVPRPLNKTIIVTRWGYNQEEEIDYDETFAPVARMESIRILIAFSTYIEFKLFQMDVKSAFLNGGKELLIVQVYVDDIIFGATLDPLCKEFAALMSSEFEMSMMVELTFFLGLQIKQSPQGTSICQEKYIKELLKKFSIQEAKILDTPISTNVKIDNDEAGTDVNQTMFAAAPKESHLKAAKRILRYLKGNTRPAKYVVVASCCAQLLWIKQQLEDFGVLTDTVTLICDNTSAMNMTKNTVKHKRTKHIDMRHHFLWDNVDKGTVVMRYCKTEEQVADIFTKELSKEHFVKNRLSLGMHKLS
ncbi:hypothetical protein KY285_012755 [Solanum tuberosum]|nr:hypothetical protein KY285_012755 [Solanum tuberosum]